MRLATSQFRAATGLDHRRWSAGTPVLQALILLLAGQPACPAQVVLNEVLYDPEGADGGQEFVELFNTGNSGLSLSGYRLEFANGATGPSWQGRWTGGTADSLAAGDYFLIVDRGWSGDPAGQAEVSLALQNGPDAVRLVRPDGTQDLLGYGEPLDPALSEGSPQVDVASGQSLARRPDGHDSDDNAADWVALAVPTPGRLNFARWAARIAVLHYEPPSLSRAGFQVVVTLHLINAGMDTLPGSPLFLAAGTDTVPGWLTILPPGQSRALQFHWQPAERGQHAPNLIVAPGQESRDLVLPLTPYQVGQDGLYLNEVMAAPSPGVCEWVEVGNGGEQSVHLGDLKLRDEDGDWRALPSVEVAPGEMVVLVQDRERFQQWWEQSAEAGAPPSCPPEQVVSAAHELAGAWPTLNNTAPDDRAFADRVYLGLATGGILDHVSLGAFDSEVPVGRSLERIARVPRGDPLRNWQVATASLGATPACANSVSGPPPEAAPFTLRPNPFQPAAGGPTAVMHIVFEVVAGEAGWDVKIFDLWGRSVRDLGGDRLGEGPRDVLWDGRDNDGNIVSKGAYIVLLRTYNMDAQLVRAQKGLAVAHERITP